MIEFKFGDIVVVPFPFTNQFSEKKRPAVVVSSSEYNRERPDIILLAVTSRAGASRGLGESVVEFWQAAGLLKPSFFKPVLFTLERKLVYRKLGHVAQPDAITLTRVLSCILGSVPE